MGLGIKLEGSDAGVSQQAPAGVSKRQLASAEPSSVRTEYPVYSTFSSKYKDKAEFRIAMQYGLKVKDNKILLQVSELRIDSGQLPKQSS